VVDVECVYLFCVRRCSAARIPSTLSNLSPRSQAMLVPICRRRDIFDGDMFRDLSHGCFLISDPIYLMHRGCWFLPPARLLLVRLVSNIRPYLRLFSQFRELTCRIIKKIEQIWRRNFMNNSQSFGLASSALPICSDLPTFPLSTEVDLAVLKDFWPRVSRLIYRKQHHYIQALSLGRPLYTISRVTHNAK